jgi:hypothetical protein
MASQVFKSNTNVKLDRKVVTSKLLGEVVVSLEANSSLFVTIEYGKQMSQIPIVFFNLIIPNKNFGISSYITQRCDKSFIICIESTQSQKIDNVIIEYMIIPTE